MSQAKQVVGTKVFRVLVYRVLTPYNHSTKGCERRVVRSGNTQKGGVKC